MSRSSAEMGMSRRNLTVAVFCHKSTNGTLKCRLYIDIIFDNHRKFFNSSHGRPGERHEYLSGETRYQLKSSKVFYGILFKLGDDHKSAVLK